MIEFKNSVDQLPYVAAYLHFGENRIQAAFAWTDQCVTFCDRAGDNIRGERIYTPMTRDGKFLEPKANVHGYNIVDKLRAAGRLK